MSIIERIPKSPAFFVVLLAVSVWFGFSGLPACGQVVSGSIVGNVADSSHAVVPGAQVTIRNLDTNETRSTTTSASGTYSFESIPPGTYEVRVTKNGFSREIRSGVIVAVNTVARADVTLQLGSVSQTVTVSATSAQLQTDTADVREALTSVPLLICDNTSLKSLSPHEQAAR